MEEEDKLSENSNNEEVKDILENLKEKNFFYESDASSVSEKTVKQVDEGEGLEPLEEPSLEEIDGDSARGSEEMALARKVKIISRIRECFGLTKMKLLPPPNELEKQMLISMEKLMTLLQDCNEAVNNVRIATIKSETARLRTEKEMRDTLLVELEKEDKIATKKYNKINKRWKSIKKLNDPLDIHTATNEQRDKCVALLERKDVVIEKLKGILKILDEEFLSELHKQEDSINILVDRIDEQLAIIGDAYRKELDLIEVITTAEKEKCLKENRENWDQILKEKNELEDNVLKARYELIDQHEEKLDELIINSQESIRKTKFEYIKHLRELNIKVEEIYGICELNKQKLKYNYDLLLNREEENRLTKIRTQRTLNELKQKLDKVKSTSLQDNKNLELKIKKLKNELHFFANDIKAIDKKGDILGQASCKKYFQLWDYNQKVADELIKKILDIEKIFYEQQLSMPWEPPKVTSFSKESLPSYVEAQKIIAETQKEDPLKKQRIQRYRKAIHDQMTDEEVKRRQRILHLLFEKLADKAGFLREDKLELFMNSIPEKDKTLIRLDQVFASLGISSEEDMVFFTRYLLPYLQCYICDFRSECLLPTRSDSNLEDNLSDLGSLEEERDVLQVTAKNVASRLETSYDIVNKELFEIKNGIPLPSVTGSTISKHQTPKTYPEKEIQPFVFHHDCPTSPTVETRKAIEAATDKNLISCKFEKHTPIIPTIYIIKALRDFMVDYHNVNKQIRVNYADGVISKKRDTIMRLMDNQEVHHYWNQYKNYFSKERQEMWDAFQVAMNNYINELRKRHKLNEDIRKIRRTNGEFKRLLQRYLEPRRQISIYESIIEKVDQALGPPSTPSEHCTFATKAAQYCD